MQKVVALVDLILRLVLMAQASFQLAFMFTKAMRHCTEVTDLLRLEGQWATLMALCDLIFVPAIYLWRNFAMDEYPSKGWTQLRKQKESEDRKLRNRARRDAILGKNDEEEGLLSQIDESHVSKDRRIENSISLTPGNELIIRPKFSGSEKQSSSSKPGSQKSIREFNVLP